jgi:hypothetical protein
MPVVLGYIQIIETQTGAKQMTQFTVIRDGYDFVVAAAPVAAFSFAMVPRDEAHLFGTRAAAREQAKALAEKGGQIALRMMETPDRFEKVADEVYGAAWE